MKRVDDPSVTAWLRTGAEAGWSGYDPSGWSRTIWILHAMYEAPELPGGLSHDDVHRIEQAVEGPPPPGSVEDILDTATVIGAPLGASRHPGEGWSRLRWTELAARLGENPFADGGLPSFRSFGYESWPVSIRPPAEGALDREQYHRLLDLLAMASPDGEATECVLRYAECWDIWREHVLAGTLSQARHQYDDPERAGAPNNIWPSDRSWFVFTDYDLWGTKVSGPERLIEILEEDDGLETVSLGLGGSSA